MRSVRSLFIPLVIFFSISTGSDDSCSATDSAESVAIKVPIETDLFSRDAILTVRLWNAEQLDVMERNAKCSTSYNVKTQTEEVHCPEGIQYQEVTPEKSTFRVWEVVAAVEVRSQKVSVGEKFRIQISGLNKDNCNTTMAGVVAIADSENIVLEDLAWGTTEMACR